MMKKQRPLSPLQEAEAFLRDVLRDGPVPAETILREATRMGIVRTVLYQAKRALEVSVTVQGGREMWS